MITADDERIYKLKPLPVVPFCGAAEAAEMRGAWEVQLAAQRTADGLPRLGIGLNADGSPTCKS